MNVRRTPVSHLGETNETGNQEIPQPDLNPKVLVLLATHNGERWIEQQINSILAQKGVLTSIYIRDDGSTDGTLATLTGFLTNTSIQLHKAHSPHSSAAQNFFSLIRDNDASEFAFVAFADQDDIWAPDKLSRAVHHLTSSGASGYSSATIAFWRSEKTRIIPISGQQNSSDFLFEGAGQGCTFVITADCYQFIRTFISANSALLSKIDFHDWAIYALTRSVNRKWIFDPEPTMLYRQHGHNAIGSRGTLRSLWSRALAIKSGWYSRQLQSISAICVKANPKERRLAQWNATLNSRHNAARSLRLLRFTLRGGRRRTSDRLFVIFACLSGWL